MRNETKDFYLEAVNRALEYIEINSSKNITLEEIASYSFLSKYHFHRVFKLIIGNTTKDYLTRLRLEKAAFLLKTSKKTIGQIAFDSGYSSPETFTRAFKSFFMLTPTQFRNNSEKEASQKNISQHTLSYKKLKISPPTLIEIDTLNIAYIRHFGSYEKFDEAFQELHSMAKKELPHHPSPKNLGIIHDNPQITEEANLRFDACIVVPNEIQPIGKIGYKKIKGGKFAVFRYSGTFETFYPVYDYLYNTCLLEHKWELRDEPIFEYYISSPPFCNSKNLTTDFYVPIL